MNEVLCRQVDEMCGKAIRRGGYKVELKAKALKRYAERLPKRLNNLGLTFVRFHLTPAALDFLTEARFRDEGFDNFFPVFESEPIRGDERYLLFLAPDYEYGSGEDARIQLAEVFLLDNDCDREPVYWS